MKKDFVGYYPPSEDDYKRLWRDGLIILDTNVILDLYRLPEAARDELLAALDILKDRLWIPYQVAMEFQRRRLTVISAERKSIEDALSGANSLFQDVESRVASLQIDKRGLAIDVKPLLTNLKEANDKLVEAIHAVQKSQLDIAAIDPIRDKLDALFDGKIGPAPADQAALDLLIAEGDHRFEHKIPPGFADADKDKNPQEATFHHDGLLYHRKFGDLIIWRQILQHVTASACKEVLLVTADRKEDWWWREKGKTVGPRPELSREAYKQGGVDLFWMYSSVQFLEHAKRFTKAEISESSVSELKEVVRAASLEADVGKFEVRPQGLEESRGRNILQELSLSRLGIGHEAERAVFVWLLERYKEVRKSEGYPDFIVRDDVGFHGYEVRYVRGAIEDTSLSRVIKNAHRIYARVGVHKLVRRSVVLIVEPVAYVALVSSDRHVQIEDHLRGLLEEYRLCEIVVGYVKELNEFSELFRVRSDAY